MHRADGGCGVVFEEVGCLLDEACAELGGRGSDYRWGGMAYAEMGPIINGETTIVLEFHGGLV